MIKSASGINSAPHMYEGDRNADLAFDTTHLNIHFTICLRTCCTSETNDICHKFGGSLIQGADVKKGQFDSTLSFLLHLKMIRLLFFYFSNDSLDNISMHCAPTLSRCERKYTSKQQV